jgi:hypothetical protein
MLIADRASAQRHGGKTSQQLSHFNPPIDASGTARHALEEKPDSTGP